MKMKLVMVIAGAMMLTITTVAQTGNNRSDYKEHPVWIQMMNDTSANYFETVEAFRQFFMDRELPKETFEMEGNDSFEKEIGMEQEGDGYKQATEKEQEKRELKTDQPGYEAEVRAFKNWYYSSRPWVRPDGSIAGPAERQSIINRQQKELKEIEKANGK
jgi:hypothetical protein